MTTSLEQEAPGAPEGAGRMEHTERLLFGYQQALGHELPNRLIGIQGLARLVLADHGDRLDPGGRELLERLADLARRTDRMVRALAQVGQLDRATDPPEEVPLTEAVAEVVAEVKLLFNRYPIVYIIQRSMPTVMVARRGLHAVLQHLLRNAARAVQANAAACIEAGARPTAAGLELWITDNGCGLSPARQRNLFEPFQGDPAAGSDGLGLFLVRQLVAGWGGSVRARSEPGKGATFTVRFPLTAARRSGDPG
jgi:signal transduction histidine kinase